MSGLLEDGFTGDGPVAGINVTPMVDVMLCLLIIFMVSTPLMAPEAPMQISVPKAVGQSGRRGAVLAVDDLDRRQGQRVPGDGRAVERPATLARELSSNAKLKEAGIGLHSGRREHFLRSDR
jgi:hypothetical protein